MQISKALGFAAAAAALSLATPVSAQDVIEDIIVIPVDSVLRAPAGSINSVASEPVPEQFQGAECVAEVVAQNQSSVHPNNDLIIQSGNTSGEVDNFEGEAFASTGALVPLTLGSTVDVSLRMGPAEVSSGGVLITIDCSQAVPPTTQAPPTIEPVPTTIAVESPPPVQAPTPSTEAPPTSEPAPTTTSVESPPPVPTTTPPTEAPPTSEPAPTTTAVAALPPVQAPTPPPAAGPPVTELPATGSSGSTWTSIAALVLVAGGGGLVVAARRRS